jgi:hypothetical protein
MLVGAAFCDSRLTRRRDLCWTSWAGPSAHPDARVRIHKEPRGFNKKKHFAHLKMLVRSLKKFFFYFYLLCNFFPSNIASLV